MDPSGRGTFMDWIDRRLPATAFWRSTMVDYYAPKNFNFWYYFGSLAMLVLVMQIATGIFLTIYYKPDADEAFASVEFIMREVEWGWLIRYMHSTGASFFFIVVYLHIFRALLYGSYKKPREMLWVFGVILYALLMAEAFMGYLLPWGQMSYWGAQVITSLIGILPFGIGDSLTVWLRGDYTISDATLNRFFAFHVILLPLLILGFVLLHLVALRHVGSNNPDGIEIKEHKDEDGKPLDGIPFHPYYTVKDLFGVGVFLLIFFTVVFYAPELGGYFLEQTNFEPADPLNTPDHIVPVWYFTPFYAMLRAVPDKTGGALVMATAILLLFFLPWIDRSPVRSIRYRSIFFRILLVGFTACFLILAYAGLQPASPTNALISAICTLGYYGFFVGLFIVGLMERRWQSALCRPEPQRMKPLGK